MTMQRDDSFLLRTALKANALFSVLSGATILAFSQQLALWMGLTDGNQLLPTGVCLILFSLWLWWLASRPSVSIKGAVAAVVLDLLWVVGSAFVLVLPPPFLTTAGKWMIGVIGVIVMTFADLQIFGVWRISSRKALTVSGDQQAGA